MTMLNLKAFRNRKSLGPWFIVVLGEDNSLAHTIFDLFLFNNTEILVYVSYCFAYFSSTMVDINIVPEKYWQRYQTS